MNQSSPKDGVLETLWNFFASVKLSVVILLSLAATSIIGTVIPQNESPMAYLHTYGKVLFSIFDALRVFDMYHSPWFRFLLCLLIINIIVCSINRLNATWKIIFPKTPQFHAGRFKNAGNRQERATGSSPEVLKNLFAPYMAAHFAAHRVDSTEKGFLIFGEKGRLTRLGVYAVHFSILLMVAGGLIGSMFGFDGYANIPEGESAEAVTLINKDMEKNLGFSIKCNSFAVTLYDSGMPKEYRSNLSILKNGKELATKDIRVNDPLRFEGINIFQSSYGKIPGKSFKIKFTEADSGMEYEMPAAMDEQIQMPGDSGTLIVEDFKSSFPFRGMNIENVFLCKLVPVSGEPEHIMLPMDYPRFDRMRGGKFVISISDVHYRYFTGLQINKDPGVPVVYAGFLLMIIGCYITFFTFHQQFCVEIKESGKKISVAVSGVSGKNRPGMLAKTKHLAKQLEVLEKDFMPASRPK